jgi:hypothetical protein
MPGMRLFICFTEFVRCAATGTMGGSIRAVNMAEIHLFGVTGSESKALSTGGFADLSVSGAGTRFDVADTVVSNGACAQATIQSGFYSTANNDPPVFAIDNVNLTSNAATDFGSGFLVGSHYPSTIQFCLLHSNRPCNMIRFGPALSADVLDNCRCWSFTNNSVGSSAKYNALLLIDCPLLIQYSIFKANTYGYLLAADSNLVATFQNCVFDGEQFAATNSGTLVTDRCAVRVESAVSLDPAQCPLQPGVAQTTPIRSRTALASRSVSPVPSETISPTPAPSGTASASRSASPIPSGTATLTEPKSPDQTRTSEFTGARELILRRNWVVCGLLFNYLFPV